MKRQIFILLLCSVFIFYSGIHLYSLGSELSYFKYDTPSETFTGVVSDSSFNSKSDTAKAFVKNELTGTTSQPIYNRYESLKALTSDEIKNLSIAQDIKSQINSAENIKIYYTCDNSDKSVNACVLNMNDDDYRYYSSLSNIGEALTNSYYNSVLDSSKYLNCTGITTINMRLIHSQSTTEATYRQTVMFDNDIAYFDQELSGLEYEMYFSENENSITTYLKHPKKNDGVFYSLDEINKDYYGAELKCYFLKCGEQIYVDSLSSLQDIIDLMFTLKVDASYFVKTPYGFNMPNEKYKEICKLMISEATYEEIEQAWADYHIYFSSDYYVTEGRLSAIKTILTMSDGDDVFSLNISSNFTEFGTTTVDHPCSTEVN